MGKKRNNRQTGARYERAAGVYLESLGYRILEYNYRCRQGEIDIIARDGEYLVFCEVKFRASLSSGRPEEAVDMRKQRVISRCALQYITSHGLSYMPCRFDVAGILGSGEGEEAASSTIHLYKNAFDYRE
ncbi:MAG: YraN family protein [Dorea sp.]|nr:YraN family protein [Dorea sp.]